MIDNNVNPSFFPLKRKAKIIENFRTQHCHHLSHKSQNSPESIAYIYIYIYSLCPLLQFSVSYVFVILFRLVLKRCVSGLPSDKCPFIPKQYLQQLMLRRNSRAIESSSSSLSPAPPPPPSSANEFDKIESLAQVAVQEPACEQRRQLGQQILIEKLQRVDSMLSRFVGNFISHFSNTTNAQEVNHFSFALS